MTIEGRNKWINEKTLKKDVEVIVEMTETVEKEENFMRCRE